MGVNRLRLAALTVLLAIASVVSPRAAQPPTSPSSSAPGQAEKLRRGQELLKRLTLIPDVDASIFAGLPAKEPEDLLTAVVTEGQGYRSDPTRWPDMHRAVAALVELSLYRKQGFKAAVYETLQSTLYQNYDQNAAEALAASQRALAYAEQFAPPDMQATYLSNVGQNLYRVGRDAEALTFLRRAQSASNAHDFFSGHNWRAIVLATLSANDVAAAKAEAAAFLTAARDPKASAEFRAYAHLAQSDVLIEAGDYDGMVQSVQAAMEVAGTDPTAEMIGYLCVSQALQGVSAAATLLPYDEAIALARRIAKAFPAFPISIESFAEGTIRRRRRAAGDLDAMLRADNAALAEARTTGDPLTIAEALLAASLDYAWLNAARQGIGLLEEASELLAVQLRQAKYPGSEGTAHLRLTVLTNLGLAYGEAGEFERARASWEEMRRVIDAIPAGIARQQLETSRTQALVGEARVAELEGNPDRAAQLLATALPLVQRKGGPSRSEVLSALARVNAAAGVDAAGIERTYEQAIEAAGDDGDRDLQTAIRIAYARFLVTATPSVPDADVKATDQLRRAQKDAGDLQLASAAWKVEYGLGLVAERANRVDAAIVHYRQAVTTFEQVRASLTLDENRQSLADSKTVRELYDRLISVLTRSGRRQDAWEYLERDKARSFSEMLRGRGFTAGGRKETGPLEELEQRILRLRVTLSAENASLLRASGRDPAAMNAQLRKLVSEYELKRHARDLANGRSSRSDALPSLREVQQRIPVNAAVLEYALLPDSVVVFVITRTGLHQVHTQGDGARLRRDLLKLRRVLASPTSAPEAERLIATVSDSLVRPVEPHLRKINHLIVVAAGALNYVPFQVLRTSDGKQIVDAFAVSNLPSASTVPHLHTTELDDRSLFVGALGNVAVPGWSALPGTAREAQAIADLYPRARLAVGDQFTAARVLAALQQDRIVHLATHGDLDDQSPLFSAVITSPAPGESTRVPLHQLMDTRVTSELVVLSACETATGKLLGGDEITGLTRTLLLAGANAVVSTLWKIDDVVTADLMRVFYRELKAGKGPAEALRAAELEIRKAHPEPAYWAPFIVTGLQ